jgi:hypothetical protein
MLALDTLGELKILLTKGFLSAWTHYIQGFKSMRV